MLRGKELVATFRSAAWADKASVQQFITDAAEVSNSDLAAMVQVLTDQRAALEGRPHALRCAVFERIVAQNHDPDLFILYVKALRDGDRRVRDLMIRLLPRVNNPNAQRELISLLRSTDASLRDHVVRFIGEYGSKQTFDELSRLVAKGNFAGRREALGALVELGGTRAFPVLSEVLRTGAGEEQLMVLRLFARAYGERSEAAAPPELFALLERLIRAENEAVALAAMRVYGSVAPEEAYLGLLDQVHEEVSHAVLKAAVSSLRNFPSKRGFWRLRELYRVGSRAIKLAALDVADAMQGEDTLQLLDEALNADHISVRLKAAQVLQKLGEIGQVDVSRTVIWLLRSMDPDIRRIAADVAATVKDPDGTFWPDLLSNLRDEDWWVRERITDALTELAGTRLTRYAYSFLQEESAIHRRFGIDLLVRIRDPESLGALVRQAQNDGDWWVRERSLEAIGQLADARAVPYIVDLMSRFPELVPAAVEAMENIGGQDAARYVAGLLTQDLPEDVQVQVLECLRTIGDPSLSDKLDAFDREARGKAQRVARELLLEWNARNALDGGSASPDTAQNELDRLLLIANERQADDVLLVTGKPPWLKTMGGVTRLRDEPVTEEEVERMLIPLLTTQQREDLTLLKDVDFSYQLLGHELRYRVNIFFQHTGLAAVLRRIHDDIPLLENLGLPDAVMRFGDYSNGLVLIGGPTGAGKSTTLAALIHYINRTYGKHIITLEDPIEVLHKPSRSLINQREIGQHAKSFGSALRSTLREDPDVILVGEMRDLDTIAFAISAAETGHLVLGTVHTLSADTTVDRILNAFPSPQQPAVRSILANCLRAICCQQLIPRANGEGRALAVEVLLNTDAVSALIRKGKTFQLGSVIATGRDQGMQSMDAEILRLLRANEISPEEAYLRALDKKEFESFVSDFLERELGETPVDDDEYEEI